MFWNINRNTCGGFGHIIVSAQILEAVSVVVARWDLFWLRDTPCRRVGCPGGSITVAGVDFRDASIAIGLCREVALYRS
jgi:hypothetical protein